MLRAVLTAGLLASAAAVAVAGQEADVSLSEDGTRIVLSDKVLSNMAAWRDHKHYESAQRRSAGGSGNDNHVADRNLAVTTTSGDYTGFFLGGTAQWRGMKYADKPERFERAHLASYNPTPRNATSYGPTCLQPAFNGILPGSTYFIPNQSEDCLSLTVRAPRFVNTRGSAQSSLLPVVVFFSADTPSTGAVEIDDFTTFVEEQNVIAVEFNFRTGISGLFTLFGYEHLANNFFYDQQVMLTWVHANI